MKIDKTTTYTLTKEDIREVCYSLFAQKFKAMGVNAYFEVGDVQIEGNGDMDGYLQDVWVNLTITENETA